MRELRRPRPAETDMPVPLDGDDSTRLIGAFGALAIHLLCVLAWGHLMPIVAMLPPPKESVITLVLSAELQQGEILPPSISTADVDRLLRSTPPPIDSQSLKPSAIAFARQQSEAGPQQRAAASPVPIARAAAEAEELTESLLSRLRANWLPPPNTAMRVRCRLRITYRRGGVVTAVATAPSCTDQQLSSSIEKAVWKSQPLPIPAGARAEGYIDVEFTP